MDKFHIEFYSALLWDVSHEKNIKIIKYLIDRNIAPLMSMMRCVIQKKSQYLLPMDLFYSQELYNRYKDNKYYSNTLSSVFANYNNYPVVYSLYAKPKLHRRNSDKIYERFHRSNLYEVVSDLIDQDGNFDDLFPKNEISFPYRVILDPNHQNSYLIKKIVNKNIGLIYGIKKYMGIDL